MEGGNGGARRAMGKWEEAKTGWKKIGKLKDGKITPPKWVEVERRPKRGGNTRVGNGAGREGKEGKRDSEMENGRRKNPGGNDDGKKKMEKCKEAENSVGTGRT